MKLPAHIVKSIESAYRHNIHAKKHEKSIIHYFSKNNLHNTANMEYLIDTIHMGKSSPKDLIDYLEGDPEFGNIID